MNQRTAKFTADATERFRSLDHGMNHGADISAKAISEHISDRIIIRARGRQVTREERMVAFSRHQLGAKPRRRQSRFLGSPAAHRVCGSSPPVRLLAMSAGLMPLSHPKAL